jgi:DNA polymerase-1
MSTDTPPVKPLILIDGSSYLYRAFHALPPLTNSKGEPTGAVFGVINMIRKLIQDYDPEHIAVVFDPRGKTTRDEIYPQYKAHRPAMPDELSAQVQPLFSVIRAMGLPLVQIEGIEADDVIATLAKQALKENIPVVISTGDKDMAQLVDGNVTLINTMTNTVFDREGVIKKFGVPPELIIDYLALIGDTSDNIPGVPKVGPKTAVKWLEQYGSLDNIIARAAEVSGKIGDNLRASLTMLPLAKQLVTLQCDVALSTTFVDLKKQAADSVALIALFKQLEFNSWLKELLEGIEPAATECHYETILTQDDLNRWLEKLRHAAALAFDTETTSLNTLDAKLVGISLAIEPHHAAYIPVAHDYLGAPPQLQRDDVLKQLQPLLQDPSKTIILQNAKYDMGVLANYGIEITAPIMDTMLESYVLDSSASRHDMDSLALKYLGKRTISFTDIAGKGAKQLTFNQIDLETAATYAAEDADVTLQLHHALGGRVQEIPELQRVLSDIELPLISVLSHMERNGVRIDAALLAQQSTELGTRLQELEQEAYQLAGSVFNLASPKQLQEILYTQMKLPILEKTPTGAASTGESVLQELALNYPLPKIILEYRGLSKLKSTYTDSLPKQIHPKTGRVHTSYNQTVTSTGRLSSTDPNLQNIPVRNEEGRRIRRAFIAPSGHKLISADYSQIELRIMAHLSQDEALLTAFANKQDIHTATAAEVFGIPFDQVTSEQRRHAKAINFGLIYGMSAFGLASQLNIEQSLAQDYINQYFARYPGVHKYMEQTRELARKQGYVQTVYGRRLYVPDINSSQMMRRRAAERAAINAPMQGTAAEMIKLAMIRLDHWIRNGTLDIKMIMQVHDELVFEVAKQDVDAAIPHIRDIMVTAMDLSVPLEVDVRAGDNWDEAH